MKHRGSTNACVLLAFVTVVCGLGCAHTMSTESTRIRQAAWQAALDDCQEVRLSFHRVHDREAGGTERTYDQLTLELMPRPHLQSESLLKSVELGPGVERGQFRFDDVEVRADASLRRVWFVDREAGRVIATLDRDTGSTTGPDEAPPAWATVDGGILLEEEE